MGSFYDDIKKHQKEIYFVLAAVGIFLLIKYIVVFILPFVIAGIYVYIIRKPLLFLHKKTKINKGFLSGLFLFLFFSVVIVLAWYIGMKGFFRFKEFVLHLGIYEKSISGFIHESCCSIEKNLGINSVYVENLIIDRVDILIENMEKDLLPGIVGQTFSYGKTLFSGFMFLIVTIIAAVLFAQDYDRILEKAKKIPFLGEMTLMVGKLIRTVGKYLLAQIEIMLIISLICFVGFLICDYNFPYLWALVTGFLDMLPFIGTAMVLLPLAVFQLLMGNEMAALILLITFVASAIARELLEPKLIGKSMGIWPIGILASVYIGMKAFGTAGVLWGPLYLLTLFELYKRLYH